MPLATLKEVMDYSIKHTRGIGMFNVVNLDYAEAIVEAAEEAQVPVILGFPEAFFGYHSMEAMSELLTGFGKRAAVPAVVHIDHGGDYNTLVMAMKSGFTSIMFDGSALDYEENIRQTKEITKVAHAMGVSVEGELGYLGFETHDDAVESGATSLDLTQLDRLTRPEQAADFVSRTGIDALAIAIGNMHGHYRGIPKLDIGRLREIRSAVKCGLVLHGGSGLSDGDFREAVKNGINKINIYTAMNDNVLHFLGEKIHGSSSWIELACETKEELRRQTLGMIKLFAGTAD
jgi:fructose-bisphosphate aldolase class II